MLGLVYAGVVSVDDRKVFHMPELCGALHIRQWYHLIVLTQYDGTEGAPYTIHIGVRHVYTVCSPCQVCSPIVNCLFSLNLAFSSSILCDFSTDSGAPS